MPRRPTGRRTVPGWPKWYSIPACGDERCASLQRAVDGIDLVFHCAAGMSNRNYERTAAVTVGGTRNLVAAMVSTGVRRLVHLSSAAVYYGTEPPLTEGRELGSCKGVYARTKLEAERVVQAEGKAGELQVTLLRPPVVYGPGSPTWTLAFARWVQQRRWPLIGDGVGRWQYVYIDNLVDAMISAAENDRSIGEVYNVSDGCTTIADWTERFRSMVGGPPPRRFPPGLIAAASEILGGRLGIPLPEEVRFITRTAEEGFTTQRVRSHIRWEPKVDIDEGLRRSGEWLRQVGVME